MNIDEASNEICFMIWPQDEGRIYISNLKKIQEINSLTCGARGLRKVEGAMAYGVSSYTNTKQDYIDHNGFIIKNPHNESPPNEPSMAGDAIYFINKLYPHQSIMSYYLLNQVDSIFPDIKDKG